MRELTVREMRAALGQLDELIDEAGELVVTRHGKPVARILPIRGRRELPSHADLRAATDGLGEPSDVLLRRDRDERG